LTEETADSTCPHLNQGHKVDSEVETEVEEEVDSVVAVEDSVAVAVDLVVAVEVTEVAVVEAEVVSTEMLPMLIRALSNLSKAKRWLCEQPQKP